MAKLSRVAFGSTGFSAATHNLAIQESSWSERVFLEDGSTLSEDQAATLEIVEDPDVGSALSVGQSRMTAMRLRASAIKATWTTLQSHHAITRPNWRPRKSATAFSLPMVAMPPKTPLLWSAQTKDHDAGLWRTDSQLSYR